MKKHYLMSQIKSMETAYLCWFFLGCHYAYLGKWKLQFLFWITLGGLGIWALLDLFAIPLKVRAHNLLISSEISFMERLQRQEEDARNLTMMSMFSTSE